MEPCVPENLSRKELARGRFLSLQTIDWRGADGITRVWESTERVGGNTAIVIIPWLKPSNTLVLIRQYRPPAEGYVIEFPAGLIDANESPADAAVRELMEETGYRGTVRNILPPSFNSPGLSGEAVHHVHIDIPEKAGHNRAPASRPDEGEHIETLLVPGKEIGLFLRREMEAGSLFDSKALSYLSGILHAERLCESGESEY